MSKPNIHFEIGHIKNYEIERTEDETESVFMSDSLALCLQEYKNKKYTEPEYFIDVWETDKDGTPYPIADVKIQNWVLEGGI